MAAANTDKFRKMKSQFSTTLASGITDSDTTIACNSLAGVPTGTAVTITIDRVDANGTATPDSQERVVGVVSSNNLTNCVRNVDGDTAQAHSAGAVVEMIWDADTWNDALDGILAEHSQAGAHTTDTIAEKTSGAGVTVDGLLIKDGGVVGWDGWQTYQATWTRTGNHTFTVEGDQTAIFTKGTKVSYNDGSVDFGVIASSSYSAGTGLTTVTLITNTDYVMAAATITAPRYSYAENPQGFPSWFAYAATYTGFSADPTNVVSKYRCVGNSILTSVRMGNAGTSNATSFGVSAPVTASNRSTNDDVFNSLAYAEDAGSADATANSFCTISNGGAAFILARNGSSSAGWTNSGGKRANFQIEYEF